MVETFLLTDGLYNMPGLCYLQFVQLAGIASIPANTSGIISENITLKSGYDWLRGDFVHDSGILVSEQKWSKAGPYHDVEVSGFYPRVSPSLTNNFNQMMLNRWVVVPRDQNKYKHLMGSKYQGCEFTFSQTTRKLNDVQIAGYEFKFRWTALTAPLYYLPEEDDAYLIPDDVTYTPTGTFSTFYYYNTSDPAIAASPPAATKRKFSVLAGKSISDFAIWLNGNKLISNDPDTGDNVITSILADGTITLSANWGNNREILIILK